MNPDIDFIRSRFPAFQHPVTGQWIHAENAGGSYAPHQVVDRMHHFFTATKIQPYGPAGPSRQAGEAMDDSVARLAQSLNARPEEIQIGPSTTMNVYVLAQALKAQFKAGDEIIISEQDHEANIGAWARLADAGMNIVWWKVDPHTGLLDVADLEKLITARTRLVCFTHCSNIAATVNPVKDIVDLVHGAGARAVVDGVSWAPHGAVDVKDLDVDFYLYSLYKTYGPHLGLLYARRDDLQEMANQGHYFNKDDLDKRLTPAGPDHGEIAAAGGIIDYYQEVFEHHYPEQVFEPLAGTQAVFRLFMEQENRVKQPVLELLTSRSGVRVIGENSNDPALRAPTIAFTSEKHNSEQLCRLLHERRIACGSGHFYAHRLIKCLGIDPEPGVVRVSLVHYNSEQETQKIVDTLDELL